MWHNMKLATAAAFVVAALSSTVAQAQETILLGVGIDAAYAPMYLAKREGLFKKHGVNVELQQFAQGGMSMDAIIAGVIQIGGAAEPSTLTRAAHADIKAVAVFNQSPTYLKLVVKPEISDPSQIKKIGVVIGSVSEYVTQLLMKKYNLSPASVTLVKIGPPEAPALLARGDIDGFFMWEPWPTYGVQQGGKTLLKNGDVGYVDNLWLAMTQSWFSEHRAETQKVLAALADACELANKDPKKAAAAVTAEAKIDLALAEKLVGERTCIVRDFTDDDMASYKNIAQFLLDAKITPELVDLNKVIQRGFYKN